MNVPGVALEGLRRNFSSDVLEIDCSQILFDVDLDFSGWHAVGLVNRLRESFLDRFHEILRQSLLSKRFGVLRVGQFLGLRHGHLFLRECFERYASSHLSQVSQLPERPCLHEIVKEQVIVSALGHGH